MTLCSERGQACCNLGKYHGNQGECQQPSREHAKADGLSKDECGRYYSLCCGSVLKKKLCDFGVQRARNNANCSTLQTIDRQTQFACCMACRDGIELARNRASCSTISRDNDQVVHDASMNCCRREELDVHNKDVRNKYHIDRCPKYGCQQRCEDLGPDGDVICGCEDGFQLSADGKTCVGQDSDTENETGDFMITDHGSIPRLFGEVPRPPIQLHSPPNITLPLNSDDSICERGFEWSNHTNDCEDIDECDLKLYKCPHNFKCINTEGSYTCERPKFCLSSQVIGLVVQTAVLINQLTDSFVPD